MSQSQAAALVTTPPQATPPQRLGDGLRRAWQAACPEADGGDVARALVANFVGFCTAADEPALRAALTQLPSRTPSRAFVVVVDPAATDPTAAVRVTARCSGALRDIVHEDLALRVPPAWFGHVPGLIRPLLMADLPTHLFWCGEPSLHTGWFETLANLGEHVVVDSRRFRVPLVELEVVRAIAARGVRCTDLHWLRLRPWRRALAEGLSRAGYRPEEPLRATIHCGRMGLGGAQLLGEWLEQRLQAGTEVQEVPSGETDGAPTAVELRSPRWQLTAVRTHGHVTATLTTAERCLLPFRVPQSRGSDGELLAAAMDLS